MYIGMLLANLKRKDIKGKIILGMCILGKKMFERSVRNKLITQKRKRLPGERVC